MAFLRFSRDKRGYEHFSLVQPTTNRRGKTRQRVLYWYRTPPDVKVGREPFDEALRRALEAQNPDVSFDWRTILETPIPSADADRWRERRRADRAARQAAAEDAASEAAEAEAAAEPGGADSAVEVTGGDATPADAASEESTLVGFAPEEPGPEEPAPGETAGAPSAISQSAVSKSAIPQFAIRNRNRRRRGGRGRPGAPSGPEGAAAGKLPAPVVPQPAKPDGE